LLTDPEPLVRAGAAYLIGHFHEDAERNINLIRRYFDAEEKSEVVRAAYVLSAGLLATAHKDAATWLEQVLATEGSDAVRIAAALGMAWSKREAVPASARALLAETATSPGAAKATFAQFPWDAPDIQNLLQRSARDRYHRFGTVAARTDQSPG
jgi:HEAT repeat protein